MHLPRIRHSAILPLAIAVLILSSSYPASARTAVAVQVPATASGAFGNPASGYTPLVAATVAHAPGSITIRASGTWSVGGKVLGPNGHDCAAASQQYPLQEAVGIANYITHACGALIGVFVPASFADSSGFKALDNTKSLAAVGINPSTLFFVGSYTSIEVNGPGTLYLGINEYDVSGNSGSLTVAVSAP